MVRGPKAPASPSGSPQNRVEPSPRPTPPSVDARPAHGVTGESRLNRIARRAYELYESRGGAHGFALEDWLQAEREIDAADDAARG